MPSPRVVSVTSRSFFIQSVLVSKGAETTKWLENVVEALYPEVEIPTEFSKADLRDDLVALRAVVPDAHFIDHEHKTIMAYEIEDSHPLTGDKLRHYLRIWAALGDWDWDFVLIRVSGDGMVSEVDFETSELNLLALRPHLEKLS